MKCQNPRVQGPSFPPSDPHDCYTYSNTYNFVTFSTVQHEFYVYPSAIELLVLNRPSC